MRILLSLIITFAFILSGCNNKQSIEEKILSSSYSPLFHVKDTLYKYGRYNKTTKKITLSDLIKFHGHMCGGLVESSIMSKAALNALFKDTGGIIDRTDLKIISNNSACGGDVLEYLTGSRFRFNSHCINKKLHGDSIIIHRISTGKTIKASLNKKFFPTQVRKMMKKIESGKFKPKDIDSFGTLQQRFALKLVTTKPEKTINLVFLHEFNCKIKPLSKKVRRRDNDYKNNL
jgi:formylmethanofuran dehydrogenase subunit E